MPQAQPDWNSRYREGDVPWDSGLPSRELVRTLDAGIISPCRTIELGCGTGTNAVYLASRGFDVTAVDISDVALKEAQERAAREQVAVTFLGADVCNFSWDAEPFEFVFDRGCYHCARRIDLEGFRATLRRITKPGSKYLMLAGNADEQSEEGPPRVHEHEIRADLGELFTFDWIRAFRFEDRGGVEGPLGWSCLMTRRSES